MPATRRSITPRAALDHQFAQFSLKLRNMLTRHGVDQLAGSNLVESFAELRRFAVSTADGAPAVKLETVYSLIEQRDAPSIEHFVRRHLEREIPLLHIEGATSGALVEEVMKGLRGFDKIPDVAKAAIAAFPGIEAPGNSAWALEGVIREALGLDGRAPDPDSNADIEAWSAMALRMELQREAPRPVSQEAPCLDFRDEEIDGALARIGLPDQQAGGMRDEIYHVAMHNIMEDALARIEAVAGGPLDPKVAQVVAEVIRRAGDSAGPKIEVTYPDAMEI